MVDLTFDVQKFRKVLRVMGAHACREQVRVRLASVLIESDAKGVRMVATDGHRLVVYVLWSTPIEWRGRELLDKRTRDTLLNLCTGKGTIELEMATRTARRDSVALTWQKVDASFPPYEQVIPKEAAHPAGHALSPRFLADVFAAFEALSGRTCAVFARTSDPTGLEAVVFTSPTAKDLMIILMPMRLDGTDMSLAAFRPEAPEIAAAAE